MLVVLFVLVSYKRFLIKGDGSMGRSNKVCPRCGRKMKQQFIGLQHCRCGMSWKKDRGFFERTPDMVFCLQRKVSKEKIKQRPVIRFLEDH